MTEAIRSYDPNADREGLWALKRRFELGLGGGTGNDRKERAYEEKLTDEYRGRYLEWVDRCVDEDANAVSVAQDETDDLVGYVFVLPESLSLIWDAAVLNEIFVAEPSRGTGVADDLMDAAVATAREQDLPLDRLVLDVDRENDRAAAFYRRHGFEHWGEMVSRPIDGT